MIDELAIPGAYRVDGHLAADVRGSFRKLIDSIADGIPDRFLTIDEVAISYNGLAGTLRGLHWQAEPRAQTKVVWVAAGAVFDVLVDIRPASPAYGSWVSIELSAETPTAVLVPAGVAHGFQTLAAGTSVVYQMTGGYSPEHARTLRWDDPTLAIGWPLPVSVISDNDSAGAVWPVA